MYLYVREDFPLEDIPEALQSRIGILTEVMQLELTLERKLAREDVNKVMANIAEHGLHLQMPPNPVQVNLYRGD